MTTVIPTPAIPNPIFGACGQTAGWIKMPLGTEVDLGSGHIVLEGVPAPGERGTAAHPLFRSMSIVATVAHLSYCRAFVLNVQRLV